VIAPEKLVPIPRPPSKPVVGNLFSISSTSPIQDLNRLAKDLGPIFEVDIMGKAFRLVTSYAIARELFDETRFDKSVRGALGKVRAVAGDGLFTAYTSEPNWAKAHNILLPNFGDRAMQGYHDMMLDIAEQMMVKWQRLNGDEEIDVPYDMTSLTLDTISLCGFGYRLNSFYRETHHPFIAAMTEALSISMNTKGLPFEEIYARKSQQRLDLDAKTMNAVVDKIVADRKEEMAAGDDDGAKADLLSYMLRGVDKKSGERLSDENIRYQIITFLIAGHETTSGLLSFAIYFLLNHPEVLAKAYDEVDRVLGTDVGQSPTYKQVRHLQYIEQILKETLRLWPPAPGLGVYPYEDEVVGGKYLLKARSHNVVLLWSLHRDPEIWGPSADRFDPDHFLPEREAARPLDAWKPFGNGQRACIGRQFAMHEAALVLGMMLQRFKLIDGGRYELKLKEAMTVKLEGLEIRVRPRKHRHVTASALAEMPKNGAATSVLPPGTPIAKPHGTPLLVLFGSNLGTSEDIARQVGEAATAQGFAVTLSWLDDYAGRLPTDAALLIVCASYNGTPPDNAAGFYTWLQDGMAPDALRGVRYTVFGCGNRNWASTYQAVPRTIDERLAAYGAERVYARGEGDSREDLDEHFREWRKAMWQEVTVKFGLEFDSTAAAGVDEPLFTVDVVTGPQPNSVAALHGATPVRVLANRELQTAPGRSTRHLEIALPAGATYRSGDHLGVVPSNPAALVERALQRFGFEAGAFVRLQSHGRRSTSLPTDEPVAIETLLGSYVEMQLTATRKQIQTLAEHTGCPRSKPALLALASDEGGEASTYLTEIRAKRISVLDLLELFPACEVPFGVFLEMLPVLTPRYYSISSSSQVSPDRCSVTVGVVRGGALSGLGTYEGVASTHLAARGEGNLVNAFVKESKSGFHLPADLATPLLMIGPGTGLAPFRGFLQERAFRHADGAALGRAVLFFGCRRADSDFLYRDELETWAREGFVELHLAFSREQPEKHYVQDLLAEHASDVWSLLEAGAVVYVCGDGSEMEPAVRAALIAIYREKTGADAAAGDAWMATLGATGRYNLDVWASI